MAERIISGIFSGRVMFDSEAEHFNSTGIKSRHRRSSERSFQATLEKQDRLPISLIHEFVCEGRGRDGRRPIKSCFSRCRLRRPGGLGPVNRRGINGLFNYNWLLPLWMGNEVAERRSRRRGRRTTTTTRMTSQAAWSKRSFASKQALCVARQLVLRARQTLAEHALYARPSDSLFTAACPTSAGGPRELALALPDRQSFCRETMPTFSCPVSRVPPPPRTPRRLLIT